MVFAIGLTGNIASGKTTAAKIFSDFGVEVINADKISKELTAKNQEAYKKIVEHFGSEFVLSNGDLDRQRLRSIIFSNPNERAWLERLLHPLIRQELEHQVHLSPTPYCIIEIPLLRKKEHYPYLNRVLLVTASQEKQIERVIERDQCTREQALAILSAQTDLKTHLENADDVIYNDSDLASFHKAIEKLHSKYLKMARISTE